MSTNPRFIDTSTTHVAGIDMSVRTCHRSSVSASVCLKFLDAEGILAKSGAGRENRCINRALLTLLAEGERTCPEFTTYEPARCQTSPQ